MSTRATDLPSGAPARKVVAATGGALLGQPTADLVLYFVSTWFYGGAAVPDVINTWLSLAIPALLTFLAGYYTPRSIEEVAPFRRRGEHEADS